MFHGHNPRSQGEHVLFYVFELTNPNLGLLGSTTGFAIFISVNIEEPKLNDASRCVDKSLGVKKGRNVKAGKCYFDPPVCVGKERATRVKQPILGE